MAQRVPPPPWLQEEFNYHWRQWLYSLYLDGAGTNQIITNTTTVITTSHTAADEHVILVDDDTAGGEVTVALPAVVEGLTYHIKKIGSTANVIVDGSAFETIDDGLTATLTTQYESIQIISDGSNWWII